MFKNLRKNAAIALALVGGMSLSNQSLHAEWTNVNYAEVTLAALRGVCRNIECGLRKNNSTSAHFKRTLISVIRIAHDILIVKNHPADYHFQGKWFGDQYVSSAYIDGCLPADAIDGLANTITLLDSIIQGGGMDIPDLSTNIPSLQRFLQGIVLPAIESSAALYIAMSNDGIRNQKNRFIAKKILALSGTCNNFLSQEKGSQKYTAGIILLLHIIDASYQLNNRF